MTWLLTVLVIFGVLYAIAVALLFIDEARGLLRK